MVNRCGNSNDEHGTVGYTLEYICKKNTILSVVTVLYSTLDFCPGGFFGDIGIVIEFLYSFLRNIKTYHCKMIRELQSKRESDIS